MKKKKSEQIVRIEELERLMAAQGDNVDTEAIVSMYMPARRARRLGAALLRLDRMHFWLFILLVAIMGL